MQQHYQDLRGAGLSLQQSADASTAQQQQRSDLQAAAHRALPGMDDHSVPSSSLANVAAASSSSVAMAGAAPVTVALPVWGPTAHLPGKRAVSAKNPFAGR